MSVKKSDPLFRALSSGDPAVWAAARESSARPELAGADLAGAVLADFDLRDCDLSHADLSEADLTGASLDRAKLDGADLTAAKLLEIEAQGVSMTDAALDEARVAGVFVECDFARSSWDAAAVRGARFVGCDFSDAEIDLADVARGAVFERCEFGDRDDVPESLRALRPEFLRPPVLEGERVRVVAIELRFESERALRDAAIGAATGAGWEPEMVAILRDEDRFYVGLRPEPDLDELEEWIGFEKRTDGLAAIELSIDPGFEAFLEEVVVPLFEAAGGDLEMHVEQDTGDGAVSVTEVVIRGGVAQPAKQSVRR